MEGDRRTEEAIELFINSGVGLDTIRLGYEETFRAELEAFIQALPLDPLEGDVDRLDEAVDRFIDRMAGDGYLEVFPTDIDDGRGDVSVSMVEPPGMREALLQVVELGLEARYDAEVEQGLREDMRPPVEEAREEPERSTLFSLTLSERVQAFVPAVKDFVRGREMEEPTQEHGAER